MKVRRTHPGGHPQADKPKGPVLEVVRIEDHKPIDGPVKKNVIAILSDDSWDFTFNLMEVK